MDRIETPLRKLARQCRLAQHFDGAPHQDRREICISMTLAGTMLQNPCGKQRGCSGHINANTGRRHAKVCEGASK
jgi:hypothetical protein